MSIKKDPRDFDSEGVTQDRRIIPVVWALLEKEADVNKARNDGSTPLMIARNRGQDKIAAILQEWLEEKK